MFHLKSVLYRSSSEGCVRPKTPERAVFVSESSSLWSSSAAAKSNNDSRTSKHHHHKTSSRSNRTPSIGREVLKRGIALRRTISSDEHRYHHHDNNNNKGLRRTRSGGVLELRHEGTFKKKKPSKMKSRECAYTPFMSMNAAVAKLHQRHQEWLSDNNNNNNNNNNEDPILRNKRERKERKKQRHETKNNKDETTMQPKNDKTQPPKITNAPGTASAFSFAVNPCAAPQVKMKPASETPNRGYKASNGRVYHVSSLC